MKILEALGGGEDALDHMCNSFDSVGIGPVDRVHDGWSPPCPAGYCHHRGADPGYSRTTSVTI